jgi:broad specificity phosphatase PhoE
MRLIITRHGETVGNVNNYFQGQTPGILTNKGIEQAKKLGLRFKDKKIEVIYSSDLQRAIDTAKEILVYHPNLKLNLDKRVRERKFGEFENKIMPGDWDWGNMPKCVETDTQMFARAKEFLADIYSRHKDNIVVVVCHGAIKTVMLSVILGKKDFDMALFDKLTNTAVSIFDIEEDNKHKIHVIGCVKHLE